MGEPEPLSAEPSQDGHSAIPLTPEAHHALHCETRPIDGMAPLEGCPKRVWHSTQEAR